MGCRGGRGRVAGGGCGRAGDSGPTSIKRLAASIERLRRWDGVRMKAGGSRVRAFRDDELRISGRARTRVRVR